MTGHVAAELFPVTALEDGALADPGDRLLFDALQERHVPVTPRLTRALRQMRAASEPAAVPPWGQAYERAGAAIGLSGRFGRSALWAEMTDQFVAVLAEPLLRQAAVNLGRALVTQHGDAPPRPGDREGAAAACAALEAEVGRLLSVPAAMPDGFWSHAGLALLSAARQRTAESRQARSRPTRVQAMLARLVYDVEPELPAGSEWQRRQQKATLTSHVQRAGRRPREGGVTGVIHTRRLEDVDAALSATFAYPPDLLVPRLMEEGFLITHRPPRKKPRRDLLLLVLNDAGIEDGPASVVKAAWTDATLRLSMLLKQAQMLQTEVGWTDVTADGTIPAALSLEALDRDAQLAISGAAAAAALSGELRRGMVSKSSLVPAAFSAVPRQDGRDLPADQRLRRALQELTAECQNAAALAARAAARPGQGAATAPLRDVSDYGLVMLLRIAPLAAGDGPAAPVRDIDWPRDRARILRETGLQTRARAVLGEILLPRAIVPGARLSAATDIAPQAFHIDIPTGAETPSQGLAELIGTLSDWMIGQVMQAIHAG
ncbi:hypothetical protein [Mesobacterium pallidum]|uniref:hypothetical protein n=1 Tax=Mesobacterium pallidum TaxID=2872037 RepID=UPI001EE379BE|nr:hypothetical protein [Mesobacterium pallidum]